MEYPALAALGNGSTAGKATAGDDVELAYVAAAAGSSVSVTGNSPETATLLLSFPAFVFDGATNIQIEFDAPSVYQEGGSPDSGVSFGVFEGTALIWTFAGERRMPVFCKTHKFAPPAGSHAYVIKAWRHGSTKPALARVGSAIAAETGAPMWAKILRTA